MQKFLRARRSGNMQRKWFCVTGAMTLANRNVELQRYDSTSWPARKKSANRNVDS